MRTQTMPLLGRDVGTLLLNVLNGAPRSSKVSREAFIAALEAMSNDDVKNDQPLVATKSGRLSFFLSKLVGYAPATLDIEAKELIEAAMNRVIEDGRNVVTLDDLRAATQSGN